MCIGALSSKVNTTLLGKIVNWVRMRHILILLKNSDVSHGLDDEGYTY